MSNHSYRDTSARRIYLSLLRILLSLRGGRWLHHFFAALSLLGVFQKSYRFGFTVPNALWQSWGYSREQMQRDAWEQALHPDDHDGVMRALGRQMAAGDVIELPEYRILTRDGEVRWVLSKGVVVERDRHGRITHYIGADFDITRRKRAEERVTLLLRDKERLLRETRHRTANQIRAIESALSGLVDLSGDEVSETALALVRRRLGAMRRLNAVLARDPGRGPVNLTRMIDETIDGVSALWNRSEPSGEAVRVTRDLASLEVDGSGATLLVLAANEGLTNAYRHGVAKGEASGAIHVRTRRLDAGEVELLITNCSTGGRPGPEAGEAGTLLSEDEYGVGLTLIRDALAEYGGELSVRRGTVTRFRAVIPGN